VNVIRGKRQHTEAERADGAGGGTLSRRGVLGGLAALPVVLYGVGSATPALAGTATRPGNVLAATNGLAGPGQRCMSCVTSKSRVQTGAVAVQLTRQHVADVLRTAGLPEMAEEAVRDLPDPVDSEQVAAWAVPYGVNMGDLVSRVGGSP
jgi:hypothetical protein